MATNYKVLGQSAPAATSATTLYAVPASTQAVISTLSVCNRGNSSATFRLSVRPAGAVQADQHYIIYDVLINANETVAFTLGITLEETDVITVYASESTLSFNAFGSEITA